MAIVKYRYQIDSEPARAGKPSARELDIGVEPHITFDLNRIESSLASGFVSVPSGLSREERWQFMLDVGSGKR